jgi:hypothetical protein
MLSPVPQLGNVFVSSAQHWSVGIAAREQRCFGPQAARFDCGGARFDGGWLRFKRCHA